MFNLEQSIIEWRRQMLAADIKAPEPMDELEAHLRDEIEQQAELGLCEADAFQFAIKKLGLPHPIQQEFKKVEKGHNIIRPIALIVGWLAAGFALAYNVFIWEFNWDLGRALGSPPRWELGLFWPISEIIAALTAFWFLAKTSRDNTTRIGSLLICVYLAWLGLRDLSQHGIPVWFHDTFAAVEFILTLVEFVPGVFWFWWMRRHSAQKTRFNARESANPLRLKYRRYQPTHSLQSGTFAATLRPMRTPFFVSFVSLV